MKNALTFIFIVGATLFAPVSHAAFQNPGATYYIHNQGGTYSSPEEACGGQAYYAPNGNTICGSIDWHWNCGSPTGTKRACGPRGASGAPGSQPQPPENASCNEMHTSCSCNIGYLQTTINGVPTCVSEEDYQPPPPPEPPKPPKTCKSEPGVFTGEQVSTNGGQSVCMHHPDDANGCVYDFKNSACGSHTDGSQSCSGELGNETAVSCNAYEPDDNGSGGENPEEQPAPPPSEITCTECLACMAKGKSWTIQGGEVKCISYGDPGAAEGTTTETKTETITDMLPGEPGAGGEPGEPTTTTGTTTTETTHKTNPYGSVTTTTTKTQIGGANDGHVTTTETTQPKTTFCQDNPNHLYCIEDDLPGSTTVGSAIPTLYEKSDRTLEGVLSNFTDSVLETELLTAATNFFQVTITPQTCPIWETTVEPIPGKQIEIRIDQHCSQTMLDIYPIIAAVLMAVAAFMAFRWALL